MITDDNLQCETISGKRKQSIMKLNNNSYVYIYIYLICNVHRYITVTNI